MVSKANGTRSVKGETGERMAQKRFFWETWAKYRVSPKADIGLEFGRCKGEADDWKEDKWSKLTLIPTKYSEILFLELIYDKRAKKR